MILLDQSCNIPLITSLMKLITSQNHWKGIKQSYPKRSIYSLIFIEFSSFHSYVASFYFHISARFWFESSAHCYAHLDVQWWWWACQCTQVLFNQVQKQFYDIAFSYLILYQYADMYENKQYTFHKSKIASEISPCISK